MKLTEPGPWRWEGDNYEFRVVNPWAVPLQKPHPRIWVPGVASPRPSSGARSSATPSLPQHHHRDDEAVWDLYEKSANEVGYESGPEHRGYLLRVHVQDTEEKAIANAREYMWMQGEFTGLGHPSGPRPPATARRPTASPP